MRIANETSELPRKNAPFYVCNTQYDEIFSNEVRTS